MISLNLRQVNNFFIFFFLQMFGGKLVFLPAQIKKKVEQFVKCSHRFSWGERTTLLFTRLTWRGEITLNNDIFKLCSTFVSKFSSKGKPIAFENKDLKVSPPGTSEVCWLAHIFLPSRRRRRHRRLILQLVYPSR